jgi:hypothetical protein
MAVSPWITHVKSVAKAKGIKFGEALKIAGKTYKKVSPSMSKSKRHTRKRKSSKKKCRHRK